MSWLVERERVMLNSVTNTVLAFDAIARHKVWVYERSGLLNTCQLHHFIQGFGLGDKSRNDWAGTATAIYWRLRSGTTETNVQIYFTVSCDIFIFPVKGFFQFIDFHQSSDHVYCMLQFTQSSNCSF